MLLIFYFMTINNFSCIFLFSSCIILLIEFQNIKSKKEALFVHLQ